MRVLPPKPVRMIVKTSLAVMAAGAMFVSVAPLASADELDDQRNRVRHQISQLEGRRSDLSGQIATQRGAVSDANEVNSRAINALQQAEAELADARAALAAAEARVAESEALDQQRQERRSWRIVDGKDLIGIVELPGQVPLSTCIPSQHRTLCTPLHSRAT